MDEEFNFEKKKIWKQPRFFIGLGLAGFLAAVLIFGGKISGENSVLGNFSAAVYKTFEDVLGFRSAKPIYELDLATKEGKDLVSSADSSGGVGDAARSLDQKSGLGSVGPEGTPRVATASDKNSGSKEVLKKDLNANENKKPVAIAPKISTSTVSSSAVSSNPKKSESIQRECAFSSGGPLSGGLSLEIIFNEIAWMGSSASANDEWLEIKNNSSGEVNLAGWQIKNKGESIKIIFDATGKISPRAYFLLERTDDNSVPNVSADKIYSGALSNNGEWLKLFDSKCNLVDEVNASFGWGNFGGENDPKKTLERNLNDFYWHTASVLGGTPRAKNSEAVLVENNPPTVTPPNPISNPPPAAQPTSTSSTSSGQATSTSSGQASSSQATSTPPVESPTSTSSPQAPPPQNQASVKILISEVMAGSSSSSDYEFLEIYNYGSEAVDLTGWTIKKKSSSGAESSLVATSRLTGKTIPVGKYLLLAHDGGYTEAVTADVLWPASYSLAYTNNSILIYSASGTLIDQVSWSEIPKDKSYSRTSLDISSGFAVTDTPSPQNLQ